MRLYQNPVIEQRADPWAYKHTDGYYYFTASVPAYDRIELRRAKTLQNLGGAAPVTIWEKHAEGEQSHLIWAPEIHFIGGKWYIYYSASHTPEVFDHRVYVLECEAENPLEGAWIEKGRVDTCGLDTFALDATTFVCDGTQYLVWAQKDPAIEGNTNLYIASMENPWTLGSDMVMLTKPEYDWECIGYLVNEGPAVLMRNGKVFITYSASATDFNYCMGMVWADLGKNLLDAGNWSKAEQPVFSTSAYNGQYGPGHNSFTKGEDGASDVLVYHARPYPHIIGDPLSDPNRHCRMQEFTWDDKGFPLFGVPVQDAK